MALYDPMVPGKKKQPEKPYTFAGPEADRAIAKGARDALKQAPPESFTAEAGAARNPLQQTAKGYPHIGLSTPSPERPSPTRTSTPAGTPFDLGAEAGMQKPAAVSPIAPRPAARQALAASHAPSALQPAAQPAGRANQAQPFKATLKGGIEYTADSQGNRTYTMGTPGQDGYGKMTVPNQPYGSMPQPHPARQALTGQPQRYTFTGAPEDAARFNAPVGPAPLPRVASADQGPSPLEISHQAWQAHTGTGPQTGMAPPKYLGPESGLGWKTRLDVTDRPYGAI